MELHEYLRDARQSAGVTSNRKLGPVIGLGEAAIAAYTSGRAWPSDDVMIKIAHVAGHDPERALLDLASWKASPEAKPIYESIIAKLVAAFVLCWIAFGASPASATALPKSAPPPTRDLAHAVAYARRPRYTLYIMRHLRALLGAVCRAVRSLGNYTLEARLA